MSFATGIPPKERRDIDTKGTRSPVFLIVHEAAGMCGNLCNKRDCPGASAPIRVVLLFGVHFAAKKEKGLSG
ncbi:hypothetical protein [Roseovarius sp.]|uniref:hypothetical protein n=1 Tax=Roseovarius sp. TaxID=1486281 RepID=UPI00262BA504|nr:hypothetical protein [Roseovarius sp.]